jgi:hypothetical protein
LEERTMKVSTAPASRFGWEGQTLEYVVKVDGASVVSAPEKSTDGLRVRIADTRQVGNGVEARVAVDVAGPVVF